MKTYKTLKQKIKYRHMNAFWLLLVTTLSACSSIPPYRDTICGQKAWMMPDNTAMICPDLLGCAIFDGVEWLVAFPSKNASVKKHEIDHVCGMNHKHPWVRVNTFLMCTEVTSSGQSSWKPGDVMCTGWDRTTRMSEDKEVNDLTRSLQGKEQIKSSPGQ